MSENRTVLKVLRGEAVFPPPLWMMRQAGRYLPEYRATRKRAGSFLDLCYDPDFAVEVTLQPIKRFGFDASILFSDILVVPHALGRDLRFEEGRGPMLTPITAAEIGALNTETFHVNLEPVYETVRRLRTSLPQETTLIGFCGAPWTVATYMIAGHGTPDQAPARLFAYREPAAFRSLLDILAEQSAAYLIRQVEAGADALQIFDSWSGVLDEASFRTFCVAPVAKIVSRVREVYPDVPIIGFPKGAGANYAGYRGETGVNGLGLDWTVPLEQARQLQAGGAVQGNLDPLRLVAGGPALAEGVDAILGKLGGGPLIFNLGHGITPETPIPHVEEMVRLVRKAKR
ncbi:uroporphyrinogen decarboxylase [Mesorhizobium sp. Root554]|uniref:uroporphyrinogen decarboxylase n=1 Tax=unclassified Mesorhizobium TaxID=325217 RepID=UPI0006F2E7BE|nr:MULTISPECIES: uroporphyrinogen decarboxylase [unclassified Mesorhizobium]KQZ15069.1 uroporphyrinogen decarboxylase [Mesorhizobium sp. Root1471]KQZ37578.1 uroporphyrinogen decarboxylase [Mesorhizobium sp. Root554]